jgi:hypothetical protein
VQPMLRGSKVLDAADGNPLDPARDLTLTVIHREEDREEDREEEWLTVIQREEDREENRGEEWGGGVIACGGAVHGYIVLCIVHSPPIQSISPSHSSVCSPVL